MNARLPIIEICRTLDETKALAVRIANLVRPGDVITLKGTLGAGKSEFARAFIKHLAGTHTVVPSPTFTILEQYETPSFMVSHFDLYRLESPEELAEIGFEEALQSGVTLIEWPERLGTYSLPHLLEIVIEVDAKTEIRKVELKPSDTWLVRLGT